MQTHEILANTLCALVVLHMAAAIFESFQVRDNLPLSMLTGKRRPLPEDDHR
ncbi:Cytochrome b [Pseudomonas syringae pv. actinidiae]|uniref:Cytochrome b n=1 Tax=Pseudomonas syringae pv. actinidiae TaxID=103796 RepID=A0A2V0QFE7_PSESF|nr:Cytochrome b [Pseudomonas syringae pv. actinidiae]